MIKNIIEIKETASTNKLAKDYIRDGRGCPGTLIVADNQTAGRGRLGKSWSSLPGAGLYCSLIVKSSCGRDNYQQLTLVAGLAVARVLEDFAGKPALLKWPNDVYFQGFGKCAGVLCEAVLATKTAADRLVVGVGINILQQIKDFPVDIQDKATSLLIVSGRLAKRDELMHLLYGTLQEYIEIFERDGFVALVDEWRGRDMLAGRKLKWCTNAEVVVEGVAEAVDDDGVLHILDEVGARHQVLSGDVQQATS